MATIIIITPEQTATLVRLSLRYATTRHAYVMSRGPSRPLRKESYDKALDALFDFTRTLPTATRSAVDKTIATYTVDLPPRRITLERKQA